MMNGLEDSSFYIFILSEVITLLTGALLTVIPSINRQGLLFGVRVPEAAQNDMSAVRIKRLYYAGMSLFTVLDLAAGAALYFAKPASALLLSLYQPTLLLAAQILFYLPLRKKTLALKAEKDWKVRYTGVSETRVSRERGRLQNLPWTWYIVSFILCVLAVAFGLYIYPTIPDILIKHWDINMTPDAWAPKSIASVLALPLVAFGMILLMLGSNILIYFTKLQVSPENPVLSFAQHRQYRRLTGHMLGFITLLITISFLLIMPMTLNLYIPTFPQMMTAILVLTVLMIAPAILVAVKAGQGGSKLKPVLTAREMEEAKTVSGSVIPVQIDRTDDSFWKLGLFYYNKEDPSFLVEDRFGNNGGLNYARPAGIVVAVLIILLTLSVYVFSTLLFAGLF